MKCDDPVTFDPRVRDVDELLDILNDPDNGVDSLHIYLDEEHLRGVKDDEKCWCDPLIDHHLGGTAYFHRDPS